MPGLPGRPGPRGDDGLPGQDIVVIFADVIRNNKSTHTVKLLWPKILKLYKLCNKNIRVFIRQNDRHETDMKKQHRMNSCIEVHAEMCTS